MTDLSTDKRIDIVLTEYGMLSEEIQMHSNLLIRNNQIVFTMFAAVIGVSFLKDGVMKFDYFPLLIPSIIFVFMMAQLLSMSVMSGLVKARARIERRIYRLSGEWLIDWESRVGQATMRRRYSSIYFAMFGMLLFIVSIFVYFACFAFTIYGLPISIVHLVELTFLVGGAVQWVRLELRGEVPALYEADG